MSKLSIITINYNDVIGLQRTLDSVTGQSYSEFEYIVIDGGSNDGSKELIEKYTDKITYWVSEPDRGIYHAMNKGIENANGEYLLFMNSGDLFYTTDILKEVIVHLSVYELIYFDILIRDGIKEYPKKFPGNLSIHHLFTDTLPHLGTFIKSKLFKKIGLYDEKLKIVSDWKFFLQALIIHKCTYIKIDKTLSIFYLGGVSSKLENEMYNLKEREQVLIDEFPMIKILNDENVSLKDDHKKLIDKLNLYKRSRIFRLFNVFGLLRDLP